MRRIREKRCVSAASRWAVAWVLAWALVVGCDGAPEAALDAAPRLVNEQSIARQPLPGIPGGAAVAPRDEAASGNGRPIPRPPLASTPQDVHPALAGSQVLGVLTLPRGVGLGKERELLDALMPGLGQVLGEGLEVWIREQVGEGVALEEPIRVLLLPPERYARPIVLMVSGAPGSPGVVPGAGLEAAREGGVVVVGEASALAAARAGGLEALAGAPVGSRALLTIYAPRVLARYRGALEGLRAAWQARRPRTGLELELREAMALGLELGLRFLGQVARVDVELAKHGRLTGASLALTPVEGSELERFAAAQQPSSFEMVEQLPDIESPRVLVTGELHLGASQEVLSRLFELTLVRGWRRGAPASQASDLGIWLKTLDGRFALAHMDLIGEDQEAVYLAGVRSPQEAEVEIRKSLAASAALIGASLPDRFGVRHEAAFDPGAFKSQGVNVMSQTLTVDASRVADGALREALSRGRSRTSRLHVAVIDEVVVAVTRTGDAGRARWLFEEAAAATRGEGARFMTSRTISAVRDAAQERRDSVALYVDVEALAAAAVISGGLDRVTASSVPDVLVGSVGFEPGRIQVFMALPR